MATTGYMWSQQVLLQIAVRTYRSERGVKIAYNEGHMSLEAASGSLWLAAAHSGYVFFFFFGRGRFFFFFFLSLFVLFVCDCGLGSV